MTLQPTPANAQIAAALSSMARSFKDAQRALLRQQLADLRQQFEVVAAPILRSLRTLDEPTTTLDKQTLAEVTVVKPLQTTEVGGVF
jgi:hypothetical protein